MKKYLAKTGGVFVSLDELKEELRDLRDDRNQTVFGEEFAKGFKDGVECVIRRLFIEELREAESEAEYDALLEMSGDFIVSRCLDKKEKVFQAFGGWGESGAIISNLDDAMHFDYQSKADEIAETLCKEHGEGWKSCNVSYHAHRIVKDKLDRILNYKPYKWEQEPETDETE